MRKNFIFVLMLITLSLAAGLAQEKKPQDLKFPPLAFQPPQPLSYRTVLAKALRVYMAEDHSLPLVNISALINYGSLYDGKEKAGLAQLLQGTLIKGGTVKREGGMIEERIDFLGATLTFMVSERTSTLSLSVLSKDLDEGLTLFFDVLLNPSFREESLKLAKGRIVEDLRQANDSPSAVLAREYERLLYGDHPLTVQPLKKSVDALGRQDLLETHHRYFFPKNMILTVAGDFDKSILKNKINKLLHPARNQTLKLPSLPSQFPVVEPGVYFIQKDINQGYISMGHLGIADTDPDYFKVQVMNFILGGGSFTSRITSKVRSDEGLAYNTGSRFTYHWGFPGTFAGYVQTKSSTVGYAIELIRREMERIRQEPVKDSELDTAKNFYLESFADFFSTPAAIVRNFANLEMQQKPLDYYNTYRQRIQAVDKAAVQEAARKYIHPEKLAILIVGNWNACNVASDKFPFTLDKFGPIHHLHLLDRLTGEWLD